jgi:hypothetical protein
MDSEFQQDVLVARPGKEYDSQPIQELESLGRRQKLSLRRRLTRCREGEAQRHFSQKTSKYWKVHRDLQRKLVKLGPYLGQKKGGKNILEARYLTVNRLASKCIQSLGLNSIGQLLSLNMLTNTVPLFAVLSVRYLKWRPA